MDDGKPAASDRAAVGACKPWLSGSVILAASLIISIPAGVSVCNSPVSGMLP